MDENWALLLYLLGIIDSSLHACLYALELMFVCYCHRKVLQTGGLALKKRSESQVEPGLSLVQSSLHPSHW